MQNSEQKLRWCLATLALLGVVVLAAGCPRLCEQGTTKLTTVVTTGHDDLATALKAVFSAEKADVPIDDIYSLKVTLTQIELVPADGDAEEEEEEAAKQDDDDGEDNGHVSILFEPIEIDLVDLLDVSEVISSAEVPSGVYNQIRLSIENPRLVLWPDVETEMDDVVHLTANGRLFITKKFELPDGQPSLLLLTFGGLKLVITGNDKYVLTPQMDAILDIVSTEVQATGVIADLDKENDTFTLLLDEGLAVAYDESTIIYVPEPPEPPEKQFVEGSEDDLENGKTVEIEGTLLVDGSVVANTIWILPEEDPEPPPASS